MLNIGTGLKLGLRNIIRRTSNMKLQTETTLKGLFLTKEQAELSLKAKDVSYKYLVKEIFSFGQENLYEKVH